MSIYISIRSLGFAARPGRQNKTGAEFVGGYICPQSATRLIRYPQQCARARFGSPSCGRLHHHANQSKSKPLRSARGKCYACKRGMWNGQAFQDLCPKVLPLKQSCRAGGRMHNQSRYLHNIGNHLYRVYEDGQVHDSVARRRRRQTQSR